MMREVKCVFEMKVATYEINGLIFLLFFLQKFSMTLISPFDHGKVEIENKILTGCMKRLRDSFLKVPII